MYFIRNYNHLCLEITNIHIHINSDIDINVPWEVYNLENTRQKKRNPPQGPLHFPFKTNRRVASFSHILNNRYRNGSFLNRASEMVKTNTIRLPREPAAIACCCLYSKPEKSPIHRTLET